MGVDEKKVLDLARQIYMSLSKEEAEKLAADIEKEVANTKVIKEIELKNVKKDVSVLDRFNSLRKDEVEEYKNKKGLLANAAGVEDDMFVLPKIVQN